MAHGAGRKIISIVLLSLVLMGYMKTVYMGFEYKYQDNKGVMELDMQTLKSIENGGVLVNIIAHMNLEQDNETQNVFMPVDFSSVSIVPMPAAFESFIVSLPFQCGDLRLKIKEEGDFYVVSQMEVRMFPECSYLNGKDCQVLMPEIKFSKRLHYRCEKIKKYKCVKHPDNIGLAPKVGTIVISHLKLEIGGDLKNILNGTLSFGGHPCD